MFITDNIDLEQSENYMLTIRISHHSFSFYIENSIDKTGYCYGKKKWGEDANVINEIQQIIFENNFLTLPYSKTNVIIVSKNYEFVPNYLLEKNKIKSLYNFTHSKKSMRVLNDSSSLEDNSILFDIEEEVYKFLQRSLFNPIFYNHAALVLNYISQNIKPVTENNWITINCHNSFIDVFCLNSSFSLQYNITLQQEKDIDCLYYIMNIWTKLNLSQEKDLLYIITDFENNREFLIDNLKKYIKNVHIINFVNDQNPLFEYNDEHPSLDLTMIKNNTI